MLKLYNTMTRAKEEFRPREKGQVKIFTCGPSIYQRPHIGNYRTFLYEDVLVRYLEYRGYTVDRSIIFTDIEDKAILEALKKNENIEDVTNSAARHFFREARDLKLKLPDPIPRASKTIDTAVEIIQRLIKKGYAYEHRGDIFFDPLKYEGFGRLFGLDMSRWPDRKVRFRRDTYHGRRWNRGDFILWHGYREGDTAFWDTSIGRGRPSWNIQDPAVILRHLGEQIDINCGGIDNIYRHHDYNIAVMEAATGKEFSRFFLHGEHLVVGSRTMSKSRGNIIYPEAVTRGNYKHRHLRFFLINTHYRKKLNYTTHSFEKTAGRLDEFRSMVKKILTPVKGAVKGGNPVEEYAGEMQWRFETAMNDDLGVGAAFDSMYEYAERLAKDSAGKKMSSLEKDALAACLRKIDEVMCVIF